MNGAVDDWEMIEKSELHQGIKLILISRMPSKKKWPNLADQIAIVIVYEILLWIIQVYYLTKCTFFAMF